MVELVKPETCGVEPVAVHVNNVPGTFDVREMFEGRLLHCSLLTGEFDRSGVGKTVTR